MRWASIARLVARDLRRARGPLGVAGLGVAAGTAALVFFVALGIGVRGALLRGPFALDRVELEPQAAADPGLLALLGGRVDPPAVPPATVEALRAAPGVVRVHPKLRFAFPATARGGAEVLGHDVGTSEMVGDGVDPPVVAADVAAPWRFEDPWRAAGPACADDAACPSPQFCDRAATPPAPADAVCPPEGCRRCVDPIPVVVSPYLVELFDRGIAPAHGLPAVGRSLASRALGVTFSMRVGESLLGRARRGTPRTVRARLVGISPWAIDLGVTMPIEVVRRYNTEYDGEDAARGFSSVLVQAQDATRAADIVATGARRGLVPREARARDVAVLVGGTTGILSLVAAVILAVAAANIASTFRAIALERRAEIGLCRAVGASSRDVLAWLLGLAATIGLVAGTAGVSIAVVLGKGADALARTRLPDFPFKPESFFSFPAAVLAGGVGCALVFAVAGALLPARRAALGDPASALSG